MRLSPYVFLIGSLALTLGLGQICQASTIVLPNDQSANVVSIQKAGDRQVQVQTDTRGVVTLNLSSAQAVTDLLSYANGAAGTTNFTIYMMGTNPEDPILKNNDTGKSENLADLMAQLAEGRRSAANLNHSRSVEGLLCVSYFFKTIWHSVGQDDGLEENEDRQETCHAFMHPKTSAVSSNQSKPSPAGPSPADTAAINVWAASY